MKMSAIISAKCIECKLCQKECEFLRKYGKPKRIADIFDPADPAHRKMAFECSLCGLCAAVCPVNIRPASMFLEMRREIAGNSCQVYPAHSRILTYERRGTSRRYTYYALPEGCDSVLFPGCTLSGSRPDKVMRLYEHMRRIVPSLGIVLDCCAKPSHDLGRREYFHAVFGEMKSYLIGKGVRTVLPACTSCHAVFKSHGEGLSVKSVFEFLAENGLPDTGEVPDTVTIHDPCTVRFDEPIQAAVRQLIRKKGLSIEEMNHQGKTTLCCGEGGSANLLSPELAEKWSAIRTEEAQGRRIITYCAGCAGLLGRVTPTSHILDLLFEPEAAMAGKTKFSRAPISYWHRMRLKRHFRKVIDVRVSRERCCAPEMNR